MKMEKVGLYYQYTRVIDSFTTNISLQLLLLKSFFEKHAVRYCSRSKNISKVSKSGCAPLDIMALRRFSL